MIVAQDKTGYYGLTGATARPKRIYKRKFLHRGLRLALTGLVLVCFFTGVLITYYFSQVTTLGYQIGCLEKELALLRVENHSLDQEFQHLASLDRVEFLARNKLGMVKPEASNVLVVAVEDKTQAQEPGVNKGKEAGISSPVEERSRMIRAFAELVNRLENRIWLGQGTESGEGTNANNKYFNPEKNNMGLTVGGDCAHRADYPLGMASTC